MAREAIPTWFFVLVVVRRGDSYLLVHERKHGGGWYLPAGRVEPGETLIAAAHRETREEAGLEIVLEGVLRIEHEPSLHGTRVRVLFVARPRSDEDTPRTEPNDDTLGAAFHTLDAIRALRLRGEDALSAITAVHRGAHVAPLSLLTREGAPF